MIIAHRMPRACNGRRRLSLTHGAGDAQKRRNIHFDCAELIGREGERVPPRESLFRRVALGGSVTAVKDSGNSDFTNSLGEQRSFAIGGGDAGVKVEIPYA